MIKFWSAVFLVICTGCEFDYVDNERLLFKGSIVDENNIPVAGLPVRISVEVSYRHSQDFNEILGNGLTEENGTFSVMTLSPSSGDISVDVNANFQRGYVPGMATYRVFGLRNIEKVDATYSLPQLRIERLIDSQLEIRRIGASTDTLFYEIRGTSSEKQLDLGATEILDEDPSGFFFPSGTLLPSETQKQQPLPNIPAKDTLQFRYGFSGKFDAEVITKDLIFDAENNTYVFEF